MVSYKSEYILIFRHFIICKLKIAVLFQQLFSTVLKLTQSFVEVHKDFKFISPVKD